MSDKTDARRLARVCESFLYRTQWAGELGDPLPRPHRDSTQMSKRVVTEIRHERRVCAEIIASTGEQP